MDEERWKKAKELFHDALELAGEERERFLGAACGVDAELRRQVHQLLASYDSDFMREPAADKVTEIIGTDHRLKPDQDFGRYRIVKLIGSGGMGEVYLAYDGELDRQVALKLLRAGVADDKERIGRFIREARAASALNHPNILTIHDVGSFEDSRFIVSEYIDGPTLRERMQTGLTAAESIEITCQVAAALNAAHTAGIVHRDIKPENVMIRRDGLVKVLDFGLAKLTEADDRPVDPTAQIISRFHTSPGLVMGTVAYMSPEQARGQAVDSRTDLWSLGVVFHEMLTGNSPFKGDSVADLVNSILKHDAESLDLTTISQDLKPICTKALARDRDVRYQSASELLQELQGEKKRMEYATQSTPYITVSSTDDQKTQLIRRRPTLSAEYIVTSVKRHKYASFGVILVVVCFAVGISVYRFNGAPRPDGADYGIVPVINLSTTEADLKPLRFASSGKIAQIAISPDGKYVAYVNSDGPEKNALRLRGRETMSDAEIVPAPPEGALMDISFSPDSSQIYYRHRLGSTKWDPGSIFRTSILGGPSTKIVEDAESGGSISPDGKTIAFNRGVDEYREGDDVIVANPDGSNERVIVHSPANGERWVVCGKVPAWSPDGKSLACFTSFQDKDATYYRITNINVSDGATQMRDEKWADISGSAFMPDGSLLIAGKPASYEKLEPAQLWLIAPNAAPKSITTDLTGYSNLSATRKGDVLVTIRNSSLWDLWKMNVGDAQSSTQITTSGDVDHGGITWTRDGRILFSSNIAGNRDIWIMNADGSARHQLTRNHETNMSASMSADGRYIVFISSKHDWDWHVFRMDANGTNLKQLTYGQQEYTPRFSQDVKWVYFMQVLEQGGPSRLCKVPIDGGEPVVLATGEGRIVIHDISSNGNIAYEDMQAGDNKGLRTVKILGPSDPKVTKTLLFDESTTLGLMQWSADGRYLTFQERKKNSHFDVISGMSLSGKKLAKPLVTFTYPIQKGSYAWSKDGKQLAYGTEISASEAVLITNKGN